MPGVRLAACVLVLLAAAPSAPAAECADPSLSRAAAAVAASRSVLRAIPIGDDETRVPAPAQAALEELKEGLSALVERYMACLASSPVPDGRRIERELGALAPGEPGSLPGRGPYGADVAFEVTPIDDGRRLVGIVARFGISCGSDAMLWVFAPSGDHWISKLRWRSPPYERVSGAFEAFQYAISPPDARADWYLVAAHIAPWCVSSWSTIAYEVLRPGAEGARPKVLLSDSRGMWWGGEDFGTLAVRAADFELRFHGASIDPGVHNRLFIRHYEIAGDRLRRTQPVAASARDFVDEWSRSSWAEARAWTRPRARERLRAIHARLRGRDGQATFTFGSIRSCGTRRAESQIEAISDSGDQRWFLHVRGGPTFELTAVEASADPRCTGNLR